LLQLRYWKTAARKREIWRKEIGEAMACKQGEALLKKSTKKKKFYVHVFNDCKISGSKM
jgi:hypothetical protein